MKRQHVYPHEETIVMWWRSANSDDTFERWCRVSARCDGACTALMDYPRTAPAIADYALAAELAMQRAFVAPSVSVRVLI